MTKLHFLVLLVPLMMLASPRARVAAQEGAPTTDVWKQEGFREFAQGRFGDGGANTYVSHRGRIQTINRWDLNGDGEIDLVFANSHPQAEKLDAVLYWG